MLLPTITHHTTDRNMPTSRKIAMISGIPFYCSSGLNSGAAETWFPFGGISEQGEGMFGRGWYIKHNFNHHIPTELEDDIRYFGGSDMLFRFNTLPCLLISSLLGGGLWETENGKELKIKLMQTYPNFYSSAPALIIGNNETEFHKEDINEVNAWLIKKGNYSNSIDLQNALPLTTEELNFPIRPGPIEKVNTTLEEDRFEIKNHNLIDKEEISHAHLDFLEKAPEGHTQDKSSSNFVLGNVLVQNDYYPPINFENYVDSISGKKLKDLPLDQAVRLVPEDVYNKDRAANDLLSEFEIVDGNNIPELPNTYTPTYGQSASNAAYNAYEGTKNIASSLYSYVPKFF